MNNSSNDALYLARVVYTFGVLFLYPPKSPMQLAEMPPEHFHAPLGPLQLFKEYLSSDAVYIVQIATLLLLVIWALGKGRWIVGAALTLALTTLHGFTYCEGKVDHDFVVLCIPLLLSIGFRSHSQAILFCLGIYFASAGFAKIAGHWLDPTSQASLSWALLYHHGYGKNLPLLVWSLENLPRWAWEIADIITVVSELAIPLAFLPRFRNLFLLLIPFFHLSILCLFGIDFAPLLLIYVPLAILILSESRPIQWPAEFRKRLTWITLAASSFAMTYHAVKGRFFKIDPPLETPGILFFPLFAIVVAVVLLRRGTWIR